VVGGGAGWVRWLVGWLGWVRISVLLGWVWLVGLLGWVRIVLGVLGVIGVLMGRCVVVGGGLVAGGPGIEGMSEGVGFYLEEVDTVIVLGGDGTHVLLFVEVVEVGGS
jgi:hypothetical protein